MLVVVPRRDARVLSRQRQRAAPLVEAKIGAEIDAAHVFVCATNPCTATAGASVIRFYLSANAVFDSGDTLLGERAVGVLGAGLTNGGTTSVTIPSGLSGTYYLFAIADGTNQVDEASESNNTFLRVVQITPGS